MPEPASRSTPNRLATGAIPGVRRRKHWGLALGLGMAMTCTIPAIVLSTSDDGDVGFSAVFITALLPLMVALQQSPFAREMWFGRARARLDEFEREALLTATRHAYRMLMVLVIALCAGQWTAMALGWPTPRRFEQWAAIAVSLSAIGFALPVFFAEITVPHPPETDEAEDA